MPKKPKKPKNPANPNLLAREVIEDLQNRLEELERYAANMAHDLKGPARRFVAPNRLQRPAR